MKITRDKYPNGTAFWLVSCSPPGQPRYRKKWDTELEANKDRARLMGTVATSITIPEMDDARAAILKLKNGAEQNIDTKGKSILDAVEFFLANYTDPTKTPPLLELVEEFKERKSQEGLRDFTTDEIEKFMDEFAEDFRGQDIRQLADPEILRTYLFQTKKFNRNRKAVLNQFFNYLAGTAQTTNRHKPIIAKNPVKLISFKRKDDTDISLIQICEVSETKAILRKAAEFNAQRLFVWMFFSGMRPVETVKFWNQANAWGCINLLNGVITVNASISKTRTNRQIIIQPNFKSWLEKYAGQNFMTKNWRDKYGWAKKILPENKREVSDICRHTFISYLCKITPAWSDVTLQAGNTREIQMKHYLALVHDKAADYWGITPDSIGVFDITEEEYAAKGKANRTRAILENKKKVRHKKNGQPL